MYSLAKFASRAGRLGTPLPSPFHSFDIANIRFRLGATSMIAGKPGAFKSILALNMLNFWTREGYPAVFFSADSDEHTVARRLAGIITDTSSETIDAHFQEGRFRDYVPYLESLGLARFEYRILNMEGIAERLAAYEAVYGDYPPLVFLDNLINFSDSTEDWGLMRDMTKELDALARETKSHICVLHHASESWGKASDPVPRAAIQGKITQIPRLVLTCAADGPVLKVCCVKNTNGPQDPDAHRPMYFRVEPSLQVTDNYQEML
jgi:AAA domain